METFELTRIFHPSLLRKPGTPMAAALDLNFDQDSMDSYSPDNIHASGRTLDGLPAAPKRDEPRGRERIPILPLPCPSAFAVISSRE